MKQNYEIWGISSEGGDEEEGGMGGGEEAGPVVEDEGITRLEL